MADVIVCRSCIAISAEQGVAKSIMNEVRITFGMIVLNGEPFVRFNLRSIYPFAHEIIVVEGACRSAKAQASIDGHSIDGTLKVLNDFKANEDTENKLQIVSACDDGYSDGFWPEKDEMSQAYAKRASGNYLWQVDSDEFYRPEDMLKVIEILKDGNDAVFFPMLTFWGGLDYVVDGFYLIRDGAREYRRLFKWGNGYTYATHRPPTVLDDQGIDLKTKKCVRARALVKEGVYLFHYSLLFPHQVAEKTAYYTTPAQEKQGGGYNPQMSDWAKTVYKNLSNPFRVHNVVSHVSWLRSYTGTHPPQALQLIADINNGLLNIQKRQIDDIETLLGKPAYRLASFWLWALASALALPFVNPFYRAFHKIGMAFLGRKHTAQ